MMDDFLALVHPELRSLVPVLSPVADAGPLTVEALAVLRATVPPFLPRPAAEPTWTWQTIPGAPGAPQVRVLIIDPNRRATAPRPAILHMHGGGFVAGGAEASLWSTQALARAVGAVVVSVEYRLAPEAPFPAALDDNYAALAWLHASAQELMVDCSKIALVGESAGGGHAAMLALTARDRAEFHIAGQALVYPMLDDRTGSTDVRPQHIGRLLWNEQRNRFGWRALLDAEPGSDAAPAAAVPARADCLAALPPTWIGVGALDLFVDEDIAFARRLITAGVSVRLNVVPGAFHLFDAFDCDIGRTFRTDLITWLRALII